MPRLPDIEAERAANSEAWDVLSWAVEPGDVILLHPACLHGGAPVDAQTPERRTLALRFFGDDATYRALPPVPGPYDDLEPQLSEGDPYRAPHCPQIR